MQKFSVLGMIGGAPVISGDDGANAFTLDVLANYSWSRVFIAAGIGAWITDGDNDLEGENSQLDLIGDIGARIYGEPDAFNVSLFGEVRAGADELDKMHRYARYGVGLRFRF